MSNALKVKCNRGNVRHNPFSQASITLQRDARHGGAERRRLPDFRRWWIVETRRHHANNFVGRNPVNIKRLPIIESSPPSRCHRS